VPFADWLLAKLTLKDELRVVTIAPLCLFAPFVPIDEIPWRLIGLI